MRNVFICAGHHLPGPNTYGDSGAPAYDGTYEANYTHELRDLLVDRVANRVGGQVPRTLGGSVMQDPNDANLLHTINWANQHGTAKDLLVDLHFDWNAPGVSGTTAYITPATSAHNRLFAIELANVCAKSMGIPVFGIKLDTESSRKRLGILRDTVMPAVLLEVCFLNEGDLTAYRKNKAQLAQNLAACIVKELKR